MNIQSIIIKFFSQEKNKGILTSFISFSIANLLNVFFNKELNIEIKKSTFISLYIIGNILAYSLDIVFAKEKLFVKNYKGRKNFYGKIPLNDYSTRLSFLMTSFHSKYFARFIIISMIDSIIGLTLLKYLMRLLDRYDILVEWKYRNLVAAALVVSFTYNLYLNQLRFGWSYEYKENFLLNILIYIWFTLIMLIVVSMEERCENKDVKNVDKDVKNLKDIVKVGGV